MAISIELDYITDPWAAFLRGGKSSEEVVKESLLSIAEIQGAVAGALEFLRAAISDWRDCRIERKRASR